MSFDLILVHMEKGDAAPVREPARVLDVLREFCEKTADQFGCYRVEFPDGSSATFTAEGLESRERFTTCSFNLRHFTPEVVTFVYRIARAADMVIFNAQADGDPGNPSAICVAVGQEDDLPTDGLDDAVVCSSSEHLGQLLGKGYENWSGYRDEIVGGQKPS